MKTQKQNKLAFIIPTKDRREDLHRLFKSLQGQESLIYQIVLVDGGDDEIEDLVKDYSSLPITYVRVYPPGFTKQKNAGAKALKPDATLVGYLDDDLEVKPGAIEALMRFWELAGADVGGVSFNIIEAKVDKPTYFTRLFGTSSDRQGIILPSGFSVIVDPVLRDTEVEWICGGAAVWRREIIDNFEHDEWFAGYGHMDDIDFSCTVSAGYRLFVLEDVKCLHHERQVVGEKNYVFGIYDIVNRHYLVKKYPQRFSIPRYYWAAIGKLAGRLTKAILKRDHDSWLRAKGYFVGIVKIVTGRVHLKDTNIK